MNRAYHRIQNAKRIVVKVGTSTITHDNGKLNLRRIDHLVRVLSELKNQGKEVILVSSGAIAVGSVKIGMPQRPKTIMEKQAVAAIGQCELMNIYGKFFSEYGCPVAQILLTKDVLDHGEREKNAVNTFNTILSLGAVPIVNENDSISTEQIEFGDNDTLSAIVAVVTKSDVLLLLSDIDGLYDSNPRENDDANIIKYVKTIDDSIFNMAGCPGKLGTGGMQTKIKAAQIVNARGIDMIITNGENPEIIYDIIDGKHVGTLFLGEAQDDA
jgi:glutamate 5-kinase